MCAAILTRRLRRYSAVYMYVPGGLSQQPKPTPSHSPTVAAEEMDVPAVTVVFHEGCLGNGEPVILRFSRVTLANPYQDQGPIIQFGPATRLLAQDLKPEPRKRPRSTLQGAYAVLCTCRRRMMSQASSKPLTIDAGAPVLASGAIAINGYTPGACGHRAHGASGEMLLLI